MTTSNAFRVVYVVQLGDDIWVVHVFQKKSTRGIKTPTSEIDLVKDRLKRLREKRLDVVKGSGNVFSDLGHKHSDAEQFKAILGWLASRSAHLHVNHV